MFVELVRWWRIGKMEDVARSPSTQQLPSVTA